MKTVPECPFCDSDGSHREQIQTELETTWLCRCCGRTFVVRREDHPPQEPMRDVRGNPIDGP